MAHGVSEKVKLTDEQWSKKGKVVSKKLSLKELEHQLWMAAHIITGPIDASDYKTYIFPILFFKRINDVYNEEFEKALELYGGEDLASAPEQHRIQIPKGCRWSDVLAITKDVGKTCKVLSGASRKSIRIYTVYSAMLLGPIKTDYLIA